MSALNPYRWLAAAAVLALLVLGYNFWVDHIGDAREAAVRAEYATAIDQQKAKAGLLLKAETDRANAATARLIELKTEQEKKDAENQSAVADLAVRLRAAAGPAARLRDPNAVARCGGCGGGAPGADPARAGGGAADGAEDSGLLSTQLTEFLLSQAADADQVNLAYTSCRADSLSLREVLKLAPQ